MLREASPHYLIYSDDNPEVSTVIIPSYQKEDETGLAQGPTFLPEFCLTTEAIHTSNHVSGGCLAGQ